MNQLSSAGNRFCFCRSEGCLVCLPFPGSPGSARKCKGEVSAWEIKGSQGKMTLWKWELDIPAQWEGCVRKHLNQPFGYFGYSRKKFNLLFKRRDFFIFLVTRFVWEEQKLPIISITNILCSKLGIETVSLINRKWRFHNSWRAWRFAEVVSEAGLPLKKELCLHSRTTRESFSVGCRALPREGFRSSAFLTGTF